LAHLAVTAVRMAARRYYVGLFGLSLILILSLFVLTPKESANTAGAPLVERPTVFGFYSSPSIQSLARGLVMVHSAQKAGNTFPWVVFITVEEGQKLELTADQSRTLQKMNVTIHYMQKIWFPHWMKPAQEKFKIIWHKLAVFKQTAYKKVVLCDMDMQFLQSGMELADLPGLSGASGSCRACQNFEWELNAGLLVLEPDEKNFNDFINYAKNRTDFPFTTAEQALLEVYYKHEKRGKFYPLSNLFNMSVMSCNCGRGDRKSFESVQIVHWVCTAELKKPWIHDPEKPLVRRGKECVTKYILKWHNDLEELSDHYGEWMMAALPSEK